MNWSDLIDYSESIRIKNTAHEAEKRSAISRAYYAGHHIAQATLEAAYSIDCYDVNALRVTHELVVKELKKANKILGVALDECRQHREWADYNPSSVNESELNRRIAESIETAKEIKQWHDLEMKNLSGPPRVSGTRRVVRP